MSLVSGIVNSVEDGTVKTGHFAGSAYKTVTLTTGNRLTCFDLNFIANIEIGKEYTFPLEQKGQYVNIIGAVTPCIQTGVRDNVIAETSVLEEPKPAEEVLPKAHTPADERQFKNRISALASAVDFLVGSGGDKFSVGNVIQTAEEFLTFINQEKEEELPY